MDEIILYKLFFSKFRSFENFRPIGRMNSNMQFSESEKSFNFRLVDRKPYIFLFGQSIILQNEKDKIKRNKSVSYSHKARRETVGLLHFQKDLTGHPYELSIQTHHLFHFFNGKDYRLNRRIKILFKHAVMSFLTKD